jgi:hypothetical protein
VPGSAAAPAQTGRRRRRSECVRRRETHGRRAPGRGLRKGRRQRRRHARRRRRLVRSPGHHPSYHRPHDARRAPRDRAGAAGRRGRPHRRRGPCRRATSAGSSDEIVVYADRAGGSVLSGVHDGLGAGRRRDTTGRAQLRVVRSIRPDPTRAVAWRRTPARAQLATPRGGVFDGRVPHARDAEDASGPHARASIASSVMQFEPSPAP